MHSIVRVGARRPCAALALVFTISACAVVGGDSGPDSDDEREAVDAGGGSGAGDEADSDGGGGEGAADASPVDDPDAPPPELGPFAKPTFITAVSLAGYNDDDPTLTDDRLELYFNSNRPGGLGGGDLWLSARTSIEEPWGKPKLVAGLNTMYSETAPEVSADGLTLWFSSNRPGGKGKQDIFVSKRQSRAQVWGTPARVAALNSIENDYSPTVDGAGTRVIFFSTRAGGDHDLFTAARVTPASPWGAPVALAELNTGDSESDPFLSADGLTLTFGTGPVGVLDIVVTTRTDRDGPFAAPREIAELNSTAHDTDPWLSSDGRHIVLMSKRSGDNEVYESTRAPP